MKPERPPHDHRSSVAAAPIVARAFEDPMEGVSCVDGRLTSRDVAKAAGVTHKQAIRAINAYVAEQDGIATSAGATLSFDRDDLVAHPSTQTKAQVARMIAEKIGIGRFGLKKRIAERAVSRPPAKPREKRMASVQQHPWKLEKHGRSTRSQEGGAITATLTCSKCPKTETIRFRQLCGSDDMDRKFTQKGWAVDPAKCPAHNRHNHARKETSMPDTAAPTFATPTPAAIAAQAKMFGLLQTHFDPESGTYGGGYSDDKIAAECKLAIDLVVGVRKQAFGELKVPSEVAQLTADIEALEQLLTDAVNPIQTELRALKDRVRECCKKFGG